MSTPRAPTSGALSGLEVIAPSDRKSIASEMVWMPKRRRSSAVINVEVAGAVDPVSGVLDAVVTTGSSSSPSRSVASSARAVPANAAAAVAASTACHLWSFALICMGSCSRESQEPSAHRASLARSLVHLHELEGLSLERDLLLLRL